MLRGERVKQGEGRLNSGQTVSYQNYNQTNSNNSANNTSNSENRVGIPVTPNSSIQQGPNQPNSQNQNSVHNQNSTDSSHLNLPPQVQFHAQQNSQNNPEMTRDQQISHSNEVQHNQNVNNLNSVQNSNPETRSGQQNNQKIIAHPISNGSNSANNNSTTTTTNQPPQQQQIAILSTGPKLDPTAMKNFTCVDKLHDLNSNNFTNCVGYNGYTLQPQSMHNQSANHAQHLTQHYPVQPTQHTPTAFQQITPDTSLHNISYAHEPSKFQLQQVPLPITLTEDQIKMILENNLIIKIQQPGYVLCEERGTQTQSEFFSQTENSNTTPAQAQNQNFSVTNPSKHSTPTPHSQTMANTGINNNQNAGHHQIRPTEGPGAATQFTAYHRHGITSQDSSNQPALTMEVGQSGQNHQNSNSVTHHPNQQMNENRQIQNQSNNFEVCRETNSQNQSQEARSQSLSQSSVQPKSLIEDSHTLTQTEDSNTMTEGNTNSCEDETSQGDGMVV